MFSALRSVPCSDSPAPRLGSPGTWCTPSSLCDIPGRLRDFSATGFLSSWLILRSTVKPFPLIRFQTPNRWLKRPGSFHGWMLWGSEDCQTSGFSKMLQPCRRQRPSEPEGPPQRERQSDTVGHLWWWYEWSLIRARSSLLKLSSLVWKWWKSYKNRVLVIEYRE